LAKQKLLSYECPGCKQNFSVRVSDYFEDTTPQRWEGITTCSKCSKPVFFTASEREGKMNISSAVLVETLTTDFKNVKVPYSISKIKLSKSYDITPSFLEGLDINNGSLQKVSHQNKDYFVFLNDDGSIKSFTNKNQLLNQFKLKNFIDYGDEPIKRDNWKDYKPYFIELSKGLSADLTERRARIAKTKASQFKNLEAELKRINKISSEIKGDLGELKKSFDFIASFQKKSELLIETKKLIDDYSKYHLYQLLTDEKACEQLDIKSSRSLINELSAYADYDTNNFDKLRRIASAEKGTYLGSVMKYLDSTIGLLIKFKNEKRNINSVINEYSQKGFNEFIVQDWAVESKLKKQKTNESGLGDALISIIESRRDSLIKQVTDELTSKVNDLEASFLEASNKIANINSKAIELWTSINDKRKKEVSSLYDKINSMPVLTECEPSAIDELFNPLIKQINHYINNPSDLPELKNDLDYLKEHDPEFILEQINALNKKKKELEARIKNGFKLELSKRSFKSDEADKLKKELSDIKSLTLKYDFLSNHYDQYISDYIDFRLMNKQITLDYDVPKEFIKELNEHIISELKTRFPDQITTRQLETFKSIIKGQREDYIQALDQQFRAYGNQEPAIKNGVNRLIESISKLEQIVIKEELELWQSDNNRRNNDELKQSLSDKLGAYYNDSILTKISQELNNLWNDIGLADKEAITTELESLRDKVADVKKLTTKTKMKPDEQNMDGYTIVDLAKSPNRFLFFDKAQTKDSINRAVEDLRGKIADKLGGNYELFKVDNNYSVLNIEVFGKDSECEFVQQAVEGLNYNSYSNICALQELISDYYTDCKAKGVKPKLKGFIKSCKDELATRDVNLPSIKTLKKEIEKGLPSEGLSGKIIELMVKYSNKTRRFNKIKNIVVGAAAATVAASIGLPPGLGIGFGAAWRLFDNYAGMKEIDLEGYEQSAINGDVAEAIDMVRMAYGPDTTVYQQLFDPSNPLINQEYVNEIEAGIDVDGDRQLTDHALNFWYDAPGDPATDGDIWSANQENGIKMYQDHNLAEQFRQGFYDSLFKVIISGAGLLLSAYLLKKQIGDPESVREYNLVRTIPGEYNHVALRFTKGSKRSL